MSGSISSSYQHIYQNLQRVEQADADQGAQLHAFRPSGFFRDESEVSLSEAAQRLLKGRKVLLKEQTRDRVRLDYSSQSIWQSQAQDHQATGSLTVTRQTSLKSAPKLEEFAQYRAGDPASTPRQQLAERLAPYAHNDESTMRSLLGVTKHGKIDKDQSLSAFEAADQVLSKHTIAEVDYPTSLVGEAAVSGRASLISQNWNAHLVSAPQDAR